MRKTMAKVREDKGLSKSEVGRRAGTSHTMIRLYEEGKVMPAGDVLLKLSEIYGMTAHDIVRMIEKTREKNSA